MKRRNTFLVTVTPTRLVKGTYELVREIIETPDDMDFLTLYACSGLAQARGYFDEVVRKLGVDVWDDLEWLDEFNRCLSVGDVAKVSLYKVLVTGRDVSIVTNTVIMVGGEVQK